MKLSIKIKIFVTQTNIFFMLELQEVQEIINNAFLDLEFEEGRHLYRVNNKILNSVSSMIKKHVHEFKEVEVAANVARKKNVKTNVVLKQWEDKREYSATKGTRVHLFNENYIEDNSIEPSCKQELAGKQFINDYILSNNYSVVATELKMYSLEHEYAGTTDLLLWNNKENHLVIADYKTNIDLDKQYGNLLYPFEYTPNTPYCKYQIQLSYYQILLEQLGLEPKERIVVWLKENGTYEVRKCNDFTTQLKEFLTS